MHYHSYHIITIGCQMNKADSERIASYLNSKRITNTDQKSADLVIINSCGVRQKAEDRIYGLVEQIRKDNSKSDIVITGCLAKRKDVIKRLEDRVKLFMPINELPKMIELLHGNLDNKSLDDLRENQGEKYLEIEPNYSNNFSAYVPIGNGCNNFCSYCVVPYARGREVYRDFNKIINEVKNLVNLAYKEINLIAQNVNSYKSNDKDFADLIMEIDKIPGDFWLRFSSSHPKDMKDKLIKVMGESTKLASHLHIAVQSGDNDILKKMNRKYTVEKFKELIRKVKEEKSNIAITTDLIVGFPTEDRKAFENSKKLFEEIRFDLAYTAMYSPRYGTVAYKMEDDVSDEEKKKREDEILDILKITALEKNNEYLNKTVKVLVEGKNRSNKYFGKTSSYKTVSFDSKENNLIGKFVKIKINKSQSFGLEGKYISIYDNQQD
ncbi:tRNA (N6-isopentenyl adenosine(37)-C2)-methylthiotransferase MiaB [Patescibacteria group bacterium]|nr:tRNA (N6-isopentenyl adenosine(37)-C2)-methylthiotransferase MiaB [Patescibacteria group bacterium]